MSRIEARYQKGFLSYKVKKEHVFALVFIQNHILKELECNLMGRCQSGH